MFHEFDGALYNRDAIEARLAHISPRSSFVARDASKFRDEYSAYPAYFGLYHLMPSVAGWVISTAKTTKQLLLIEEPDVASFLRLQLSLFQFPNGMGAAYYADTNNLRVQANSRKKTLSYIQDGVHLSPLRLIVACLLADTKLRLVSLQDAVVTLDEVFALANQTEVNRSANPNTDTVAHYLELARANLIQPPARFEKRFHLLNHLELFNIRKSSIRLRKTYGQADTIDLETKILAIAQIDSQFTGFDHVTNAAELEETIKVGTWANYFDAVNTIPPALVHLLSSDIIFDPLLQSIDNVQQAEIANPVTYPLRARDLITPPPPTVPRKQQLADPEVTRIKRQRRNLIHKKLVEKFDDILRAIGAEPLDTQHIDLCALIPKDGTFIFEMKSGGVNILAQIRKGLSQLYEYRFRYKHQLEGEITLCMVLGEDPLPRLPWLNEYLCVDRYICLCWYSGDDLIIPDQCADRMQILFEN